MRSLSVLAGAWLVFSGCNSGASGGAPDAGTTGGSSTGGKAGGGHSGGGHSNGGASTGGSSTGGSSTGGNSSSGGASGAGGSSGGAAGEAGSGGAACNEPFADCANSGSCQTNLSTDSDHCGACGSACAFLSVCANWTCSDSIDPNADPYTGVHVDAIAAYWFSFTSPNTDLRMISNSGTSYQTLATVPDTVSAAALSATSVIAVSYSATGSKVWSIPKSGGTPQVLGGDSDGVITGNVHENAAVGSGYAFWVGAKGVYRVPLSGGPSEHWVKTACARRLVANADTVYFSCYQDWVGFRKAADPPNLDFTYGKIDGSEDFAVDSTHLYYFGSGGIFRKPKTGGVGELLIGGAVNGALEPALTVDDHNVYWGQDLLSSGSSSRPVYYAAKQPGAQGKPLWEANNQVERITSNDTWVYWIDNASRLFRTKRP